MTMNNQQKHLVEGLQELWKNKELTDVTLVAEDSEIHCHRNVLAASSLYFRAMFRNYRESGEKRIELHDMTFQALDQVVKFIYSGEVDISHDNVQCLLTASSILQLDTLLIYCTVHMAEAICLENCVDVYLLADYQNLDDLKHAARLFILDNFGKLAESKDVFKLEKKFVKDLLLSDDLNVDKEEKVFMFLVGWVEYDLENRKRMFADLFHNIRLMLMCDDFITEHVEKSSFVSGNPFSRAILSTLKLCKIGIANQETEQGKKEVIEEFELNVNPRLGMFRKQMLIFSGGGNSEDQRGFSCFDPTSGENYCAVSCNPTFDSKFKIDYYQLVTNAENQIYFLGGVKFHIDDNDLALDSVYRYNPKEKAWKRCQPMNSPRCAFAACSFEDKLFVFGGEIQHRVPLDGTEMYDPVSNSWHQMEPLPMGLSHHAATIYKDNVLIFGGARDTDLSNLVLQYSVSKDNWTILDTDILKPCLECTAITDKNKIYILGGGTKTENMTSVQCFDPETLKWEYGGDFPDDRKFFAVALLDGCIYVCGGVRLMTTRGEGLARSRKVESKDMYKYDPETEEWSKVANLVQYGSFQACTTAIVNTKDLTLSDFVSSV